MRLQENALGDDESSHGQIKQTFYASERRRFTLLELLVVTAIMGILAAFILPALSAARLRSMGQAGAEQQKQMSTGFGMYADDSDGFYYPSPTQFPSAVTDSPYLFCRNPDLRNVSAEYEFDGVTSHPVTGAPAWTDEGNFDDVLWNSWCYLPGYLEYQREMMPGYDYPTGPSKSSRASEQHVMMTEMVVDSPYGPPRAVHVEEGERQVGDAGVLPVNYGNSSFVYFVAQDQSYLKGTFALYYDGHSEWVDFEDMISYFLYSWMPHSSAFSGTKEEIVFYPKQGDF